jgi:outer membrane protein assembly factor BamD (BamD/ComL family)
MKPIIISFLAGLSQVITAASSYGDLSSPLYARGIALYNESKYSDARTALEAYENADRQWLSQNLQVKSKIDEAIADCKKKEQVSNDLMKYLIEHGTAVGDIVRTDEGHL